MTDIKITTPYKLTTEDLPHAASPEFFSRGYNDFKVNQDGDIEVTTGVEKLKQDILKFLVTERGSNPNFPGYGVDFSPYIGKANREGTIQYMKAKIKDEITTGLQTLQTTFEDRPLEEQIGAMIYFDAKIKDTQFNVKFTLLSAAREELSIFIILTEEGGITLA